MRALAFAAAIPLVVVCARAEEPEKPAYISIEILDASGNTLMDSVTEQDGLLIWSGTASLTELPPEKKEAPVIMNGNSRNRNNVPLYFQNQYPDVRYGSGSVATSGCSITCLAMVASYMGIVGFLAGVLFRKGLLRRSRGSLATFGAFAAVIIYGGIMNPAAAMMYNSQSITLKMLMAYYVSGLPMDLIHAAATVIFILIAAEPMLEKLDRIKVKYGLVE